jgi:hypothetical protein
MWNVFSTEAAMADMEIIVKAITGRTAVCEHGVRGPQILTFSLCMKTSDTILGVKNQIQVFLGIAPDEQTLIFAGQSLENDRTLADHNIRHGSTLHMQREFTEIEILIRSSVGPSSFRVTELMPSDTIRALKAQIRRQTGIHPTVQLLMFAHSELQDHGRTLLDENIQDGSTVCLFLQLTSTAPSSST